MTRSHRALLSAAVASLALAITPSIASADLLSTTTTTTTTVTSGNLATD